MALFIPLLWLSLVQCMFTSVKCAAIISSTATTTAQRKLIVMTSDETEQIQGEIIVQSASLTVHGPPKGFPMVRHRRDLTKNHNKTALIVNNTNVKKDIIIKSGKKFKIKQNSGIMKKIMPYMLVPAMMGIGYAPMLLANLKMFVMSALMINMMAFNAAIFLTLRNMVFGPRIGEHITYYNFGYNHKKHKYAHQQEGS